MPLPVIAGVLRATVAGSIAGGGRWSNTWHGRTEDESTPDLTDVTAFHTQLLEFYVDNVLTHCPAATVLDSCDYTPLDGSSGAFHFTESEAGTDAGAVTAAEVAEVLTIRTALRGRQNRGRVFLPAFTTNAFDSVGHIGSAIAASVVAGIVARQAALILADWSLGVGSYGPYKNPTTGLLEAGTPHFTPVQSFSMDQLADVIRSRKD